MAAKSRDLDQWRDYFGKANSDVFDVIEHAIIVAASDCPKELRARRDRIAELLFSCGLTRCTRCNGVESRLPRDDDVGSGRVKTDFDGNVSEINAAGIKESKAKYNRDDQEELNVKQVSNYSYGEAEALTDEIEEENQTVGEVLRIKQILQNFEDEPDSVLFDSLRRLQLMALNVDILRATEIGKAVNCLRRRGSKRICHVARELIEGWKVTVDEWVKATQEIAVGAESTPDSVNPSVLDEEEGLPSPPLDEGAFCAVQNIELSQIFDGMDDDGNPRNRGECNKVREGGNKLPVIKQDIVPRPKEQFPKALTKENSGRQMKEQDTVPKRSKASNTQSGPGRPVKLNGVQKISNEAKLKQKSEQPSIPKGLSHQSERARCSDDDAVQLKLEASKRKLQERYQEAENAKRQRTIQLMELHDLPKHGLRHKNTHAKLSNYNQNRVNGPK
ncbi:hypothetical protein Nepgr_030162 [Nepenthes gracilis]|uniref:TFIIS N-terminal domain-containing protein n=1 Tax=Nepenthes gracilis TaxID=150966 RepID=A0AAD3Y5T5_NEPGR|nr:hypothetical protein Nepgr_030162 [Nepenthes gracilis]